MAKRRKFSFEDAAEMQAERIYEKLEEVEPGTKEYRELQNELGAFEIMKEKRRQGKISVSEWSMFCAKFLLQTLMMGLVLTADWWIPRVSQRLKIEEMLTRFMK